jgi:pimeloyl-ACP methyl ester carboxylesterase
MPNTNDLLMSLSSLSVGDVAERLARHEIRGDLEALFGAADAGQISRFAAAPRALTGEAEPPAVVLIPGIMGSLLRSIRGSTDVLWVNPVAMVQGRFNELELDENGLDRAAHVEIVAFGLEKLTYLKMSLALHREAELFEFPFDWRRSVEDGADLLARCLERWAAASPGRRFTLVAHSLGGLLARAYLVRYPLRAEALIGRVINLGTPFRGAPEIVQALLVGNPDMSLLGMLSRDNDPRRFLRSIPGAYALLPAPPELAGAAAAPFDWDLHDAAAWGVPGIRQPLLTQARATYAAILGADPQVAQIQIAGGNRSTITGCHRTGSGEAASYGWLSAESGAESGDGTVPLSSALIPGLEVYYSDADHRGMANDGDVICAVLALLRGEAPELPRSLMGTRSLVEGGVTPDLDDVPDPRQAAHAVRGKIADGTASRADLGRLLFL